MILGLDAGSRTVTEAEHLLHATVKALGLPADTTVGCTHFVRTTTGAPHVACSLTVQEPTPASKGSAPAPPSDGSAIDHLTAEDVSAALAGLGIEGVGVVLGDDRSGPEDLVEGATLVATEHASGSSGRIALFPGRSALTGTLTVAQVLARSAIDHVAVLAQAEDPSPDTPVATNDHVRPQWRDARMVLLLMPASGGRLMPAEVPNPTPCCADHT